MQLPELKPRDRHPLPARCLLILALTSAACADAVRGHGDASDGSACINVSCLDRPAPLDRQDSTDSARAQDSADGVSRDGPIGDAPSDVGPRADAPDGGACSRVGEPCASTESCQADCSDAICAPWLSFEAGKSVVGSFCQAPPFCSAGDGSTGCPIGSVCVAHRLPVGGVPQGVGCLPAATCVSLIERYGDRSGNVFSDQCWYTDGTRARTGALPQARCGVFGRQTCGLGCGPCPDGYGCAWWSEQSPTGVCLRGRLVNRPIGADTFCFADGRTWQCDVATSVCLLPVRRGADGIPDADRRGACVLRGECEQLVAALPGEYRCVARAEGR